MSKCEQVVIVLANLMGADGTLNEETAARVDLGYNIFKEYEKDFLFFIGWDYRADSSIAIADAMKNYLETRAIVPKGKILINRLSRESVGDAVLSRLDLELLFSNYELSVVSSDYHIPRLEHIFSRIYGIDKRLNFYGVDMQVEKKVIESEISSLEAFEKTFEGIMPGDLPSFVERLKKSHPYYNGDIFPILSLPLSYQKASQRR